MNRVKNIKISLSPQSVSEFFENRAKNFNIDQPLTTTMYNDHAPDIVVARDAIEREKIIPFLELDKTQKVLDIGCGIGRWLFALQNQIAYGLGVDASVGLIHIARSNCTSPTIQFEVINTDVLEKFLNKKNIFFDRVMISGLLMYLNDDQVLNLFKVIKSYIISGCIICIREPIAKEERLTLKDYWSDELNAFYSAIYRNSEEVEELIRKAFGNDEFYLTPFVPLFDDCALNNRSETQQKFCIVHYG